MDARGETNPSYLVAFPVEQTPRRGPAARPPDRLTDRPTDRQIDRPTPMCTPPIELRPEPADVEPTLVDFGPIRPDSGRRGPISAPA